MSVILQVALGGAIGSVLRYLITSFFGTPWAVMGVNVAGSFIMGVLYITLSQRIGLSPLLMTGVLGGFTTFSAFSLDVVKLVQAGHLGTALIYAGGTVFLSLVAVGIGVIIARGLT